MTDRVLGEVVAVLEIADGWARTRGEDGYEGWSPADPLSIGTIDAPEWRDTATLTSLGTSVEALGRVPWGARVRPAEAGRVELPDGRSVVPRDPARLLDANALAARRPPDGAAVGSSALEWLDVPYVWGGRTELGVDCSGFVQVVFAVHGIVLPRDSHAQRDARDDADVAVGGPGGGPGPEPGDLLFFAPEGRSITHVGIVLDGWRMVHASSTNGRVAVDDLASAGPLPRLLRGSLVACTRVL